MNEPEALRNRLPTQPEYRSPALHGRLDTSRADEAGPRLSLGAAGSLALPSPSEAVLLESRNKPPAASSLMERITSTEAELARLSARLIELKQEWEGDAVSQLRNQFDMLSEAVRRYSFTCAEVDMRLALIRARADESGEAAENLRRSLAEQTAASDELRHLARSLR